ncbi:MAG: hypothetical protein H5T84_01220, partial [Thermoleophilia bacterium]|nr:hypothetical protein [Thermoleophilia bacterium]
EMRFGRDVLFVACGPVVYAALEAADMLRERGIDAGVAHVSRPRPLDQETLLPLIQASRAVVTVEDNVVAGGFGSLVLEAMAEADLWRPCARVGLPDRFVTHGPVQSLYEEVGLTAGSLAEIATRLVTNLDSKDRTAGGKSRAAGVKQGPGREKMATPGV